MMKPDIISILTELNIKEIATDSRQVVAGGAFFCIAYSQEYIKEAESSGASLIVVAIKPDFKVACPIVVVGNIREAVATAASWLYPRKPAYITAVTGTSGKSSVVDYFRQLGTSVGLKVASIGTMGIRSSDKKIEKEVQQYSIDKTGLNTPDVITTYKILNFLALKGVTHVAFEASSHGLEQKRLLGVPMCAAGFVSFSHDHLDYHLTIEAYRFAKLKLFSENLINGGKAILTTEVLDKDISSLSNKDPENQGKGIDIITVGEEGDVKILFCESSITEQKFKFSYRKKTYETTTSLIGSFQARNILLAATMLEACEVSFDEIIKFVPSLKLVAGRLERVTHPHHPWHVFVDYAHKPNAVDNVLQELKRICGGKLMIIFGCGGDRDRLKRPIMGEIASSIADIVIVTDDNPRTEDPASIRAEVMRGCPHAIEIGDREEAIKYGISLLQEGDILLIAGKGHEEYQIIGDKKIEFSDVEMARKYII